MVKGYYEDIIAELVALGNFRIEGGKHQKWWREGGPVLTVPHKVLSRHTANGILKDAGLPKKF